MDKIASRKDAYLEGADTFFLNYEQDEMDVQELQDIQTAVDEAHEQADCGQGVLLQQFDAEMRAKHGICG